MHNLHHLTHPVVKDLVSRLRDADQDASSFQSIIAHLTTFLVYEALSEFAMYNKEINTWQGKNSFDFIDQDRLCFVPILRAGMPMLTQLNQFFPNAVSGFVAMKRDEQTQKPNMLYDRVPNIEGKTLFLLDPMVATGGSLDDALRFMKKKNPHKIICLNLVGYQKTMEKLAQTHKDIQFYIAQIDPTLNENGFILPGIGDAGDRAYNTL